MSFVHLIAYTANETPKFFENDYAFFNNHIIEDCISYIYQYLVNHVFYEYIIFSSIILCIDWICSFLIYDINLSNLIFCKIQFRISIPFLIVPLEEMLET